MRILIVLLVVCLLSVQAAGTDLILGAELGVEWDDNVLSRSDEKTSDYTLIYGPRIELDDPEGRFRWRARYSPDYQDFLHLNDLDGWDHDARLDIGWDLAPRTTVRFSDQYLDVAQFTRLIGTDSIGPDVPLVAFDRQGLKRNNAELSIDHLLGARHVIRFDLSNTDSDFEGARADTNFTSASLNYSYVYSPRTRIGWLLSAQQQAVDRPQIDTVETNFYNLSLQWTHEFDPSLSLSVSAGPALVDRGANDPTIVAMNEALYPLQRTESGLLGPVAVSTCPTLDDGTPVLAPECDEIPFTAFADPSFLTERTDVMLVGGFPESATSDVTYFASVNLTKEWSSWLTTSLQYRRSALTTGGQGGQVSDYVVGIVNWRPLRRLRVTFTASWENREQATGGVNFVRTLAADTIQGVSDVGRQAGLRTVAVDRDIRNVRYSAALSLRYQLTEQTAVFSRMFWYEQEIKDTAIPTRKTTRFRVVLGVAYFFEPIGLPI